MPKRLLENLKIGIQLNNFAFLVFLCVLSACSEDRKLNALTADTPILAFGDSLTYGTGAKQGEDYPSQLSKLLNIPIINAGIAGEISKDGLARLPALLDKHEPQLLILIHGGNDILRKLSSKELKYNLLNMIQLAEDRNIPAIILGVPEPGIFLSSSPVYEEVAKQKSIPAELSLLADIISDRSLKSDTVHPNAMGYQKIAEGIFKFLQHYGAIK